MTFVIKKYDKYLTNFYKKYNPFRDTYILVPCLDKDINRALVFHSESDATNMSQRLNGKVEIHIR